MVESRNEARGQWSARTSQNKVFNFTAPDGVKPSIGAYVTVVTNRQVFPTAFWAK